MGVTGLWTVLQPCARPIKLETLNKKRLAVDASIWIYQFLKAVRDKEGNALRNSHVVGFFRRICKLLFFGIKPVFVFDGGAPVLKRQTISGRKARREGRREDAIRTAGKLLAVQMKRRAEEEERKRKEDLSRPTMIDEEPIPENLVYVDELQMTESERQQHRKFKKQDAYHLPELTVSMSNMGAPNDPRIMSTEELEAYAKQFHDGEDVSVYDFSKIDFDGVFFRSLPVGDRSNILNAARLRSRLRMGYSKEQLDIMFPDRMAFSKFQVERVRERNELTQRLMNLNGMNEENIFGVDGVGRIAGERGKEYVLVKNDTVDGGWALGVVSHAHDGQRERPIDVDRVVKPIEEDEDEEEGFEDIPIEGLNRLPRRAIDSTIQSATSKGTVEARQRFYLERQKAAGVASPPNTTSEEADPDSLFIPEDPSTMVLDELFADSPEDEDLKKAIAMSLEVDVPGDHLEKEFSANHAAMLNVPRVDQPLQFNAKNARAGRAFAHVANARAHAAAPRPFHMEDDAELQASQDTNDPPLLNAIPAEPQSGLSRSQQFSQVETHGFDGPLPFESINLGKSIFTKKKKQLVEEGGGFEKEDVQKPLQVVPPWFSQDVTESLALSQAKAKVEAADAAEYADIPEIFTRQRSREVIDLEAVGVASLIEIPSDDELPIVLTEEEESVEDSEAFQDPATQASNDGAMSSEAVIDEQEKDRAAEGFDVDLKKTSQSPRQDSETNLEASAEAKVKDAEEKIEWEENDPEANFRKRARTTTPSANAPSSHSSPEFEDVSMAEPMGDQMGDRMEDLPNGIDESQPLKVPESMIHEQSFDLAPEAQPTLDLDDDEFSDPEDEDLMRQLAIEAEEHARFAASLTTKSHSQSAEDYELELRQLRSQQKKDRRDADEVSHIMITECQQLLQLFGLPYITAPMEAEAQCAELVRLGLVDGIVTDDSDIFLFGGTRVYKNMFNQAKYVECYLSSDLEKEYSLTREKVIQIAHLLGSDYTEGLVNVGPVTALEILSEFGNLELFGQWWTEVQKGVKLPSDDKVPFRRKFKRNAAKIFLPSGFPDKRVDEAYLRPEVDSDPSPFAWGVPDLDALRRFLMATIGWTQERADEILVPVIRDMNRRENEGTQANITRFFDGNVGAGPRETGAAADGAFAPRRRGEGRSKRMETALVRLHAQATHQSVGNDENDEEGLVGGSAEGSVPEAVITGDIRTEKTRKKPKKRAAVMEVSDVDDEPNQKRRSKGKRIKAAISKE